MRCLLIAIVISIAFKPNTVNALDAKDKEIKDLTLLIKKLTNEGEKGVFGPHLAPVVGLPHEMQAQDFGIVVSSNNEIDDARAVSLVFDEVKTSTNSIKLPICIYFQRFIDSPHDRNSYYYRADLKGKLEKAVKSNIQKDENLITIRGSGIKTDLDINSPHVQAAFKTEYVYWVKDWLKAQKKEAKKAKK